MNTGMLQGLDEVVPLMTYMASLPLEHPIQHVSEEGSYDAKGLVVSLFGKKLLYEIPHSASDLSLLDANHDGTYRQYLNSTSI